MSFFATSYTLTTVGSPIELVAAEDDLDRYVLIQLLTGTAGVGFDSADTGDAGFQIEDAGPATGFTLPAGHSLWGDTTTGNATTVLTILVTKEPAA